MTEPGVEPTSSGCMTGDSIRSSEKVSCDKWYWNPSLINRDICVAATAHNRANPGLTRAIQTLVTVLLNMITTTTNTTHTTTTTTTTTATTTTTTTTTTTSTTTTTTTTTTATTTG